MLIIQISMTQEKALGFRQKGQKRPITQKQLVASDEKGQCLGVVGSSIHIDSWDGLR